MKQCPFCGQEVSDETVHCPKCLAGIPHKEQKEEKPVEAEEQKQTSRRKVRS